MSHKIKQYIKIIKTVFAIKINPKYITVIFELIVK